MVSGSVCAARARCSRPKVAPNAAHTKDSTTPSVLGTYLERYPNGEFSAAFLSSSWRRLSSSRAASSALSCRS